MTAPKVALYEGTVRHRRQAEVARAFSVSLFYTYVDVDAIPEVFDPLPLWSARRRAPVHFQRKDFYDGSATPLGDAVRSLVQGRIGRRPEGTVGMLGNLRTFGWLFNPIVVYYCWDADESGLDAVVLEISNTPWGERSWHVFDAHQRTEATAAKAMHVSPFLPMDVDYRVTWDVPGSDIHLDIAVERHGDALFDANLSLRRIECTPRQAVAVLVRHPLMPLQVSTRIYVEAARIRRAGVRYLRHPGRSASEPVGRRKRPRCEMTG